jgi:hypothetical protein
VTTRLSKAERLALGGAVAPIVRTARARRITLVNKEGKPAGTTTSIEVAKSLLARCEIEFSVQPGKRPEFVTCKRCGRPVKAGDNGRIVTRCRSRAECRGKEPARVKLPRKPSGPARARAPAEKKHGMTVWLSAEEIGWLDLLVAAEQARINAVFPDLEYPPRVTRSTYLRYLIRRDAAEKGLIPAEQTPPPPSATLPR